MEICKRVLILNNNGETNNIPCDRTGKYGCLSDLYQVALQTHNQDFIDSIEKFEGDTCTAPLEWSRILKPNRGHYISTKSEYLKIISSPPEDPYSIETNCKIRPSMQEAFRVSDASYGNHSNSNGVTAIIPCKESSCSIKAIVNARKEKMFGQNNYDTTTCFFNEFPPDYNLEP